MNDSIDVFETPVDSIRVAAEDITSNEVTQTLDLTESLQALWNLVHVEYIAFVCVAFYIVVTRVRPIKTNSKGRRNILMLILTAAFGLLEYFWRGASALSLFTTALMVNASQEYIFMWIFKALEKFGWTPLPEWHVEEIREEKQKDIAKAEAVKKQPLKP